MTTIEEYLRVRVSEWARKRLERLRELDAPSVILRHAEERAADPLGHVVKKGLREFGGIEFYKVSEHTGRGGKKYLRFKDPERPGEDVLYVAGKWGKYLYRQKAKAPCMTLTDVLVIVDLVQAALPRLDFSDPDQVMVGNELLWLVNHVGAAYEYQKGEREYDAGRTGIRGNLARIPNRRSTGRADSPLPSLGQQRNDCQGDDRTH